MSGKLKILARKVSFLGVALLFVAQSFAQVNKDALNGIMEQRAKALKNNATTFAAGNKDSLFYKYDAKTFNIYRGQGYAGYISELFTTALVLTLVDEGKISLDDKIVQYLPSYAKYGKNYITIRHCLTHNTGIQVPSKLVFFEKSKFSSLEDEVNSFAAKDIQTNPGEEFRYNDRGFLIAARIAEIVTKKKFDNIILQRLFRPLGMRQTTFQTLDGTQTNPAFGARTTSADMMTFLQMLLNKGTFQGQHFLSENSIMELRKISAVATRMNNAPKELAGLDYTLGTWAPEQKDNIASVLVSPSYGGTIAVVDFCRGYAYVYLQKELTDDPKLSMYNSIKPILDEYNPSTCK